MTVLYVFAHFDDEYGAVPLIREASAGGEAQWFFYVADYRTPDLAARRLAETRRFLERLGVAAEHVRHVGEGTGALDGAVHAALPAAYAALRAAAIQLGVVDRMVVNAFEGGHMDHDACAALAAELARELGVPRVEQVALYNGLGIGAPLFHGATPIAANGPIRRMRLPAAAWLSWALSVVAYPSQAKTWLGLWPAMFWSYLWRGYGVQTLAAGRVLERPHAGVLLYERMFGRPYDEVRAAIDAFLRRAPDPAG